MRAYGFPMDKRLLMAVMCLMPFILGWQNIELRDYLASQRQLFMQNKQDANKTQKTLISFPGLTPYRILEKATASFYKAESAQIEIEVWLENPLFHIKSTFNTDIKNLDDYRTNGKVAASLLLPGSISTSQWVQAYRIGGIPFSWDLQKREWVENELNISGSDSKKVLAYGVLMSLFSINAGAVDFNTINFRGIERRKGRECFLLQYNLDPKIFERWGVIGDISVKVWVDTSDFLPRALRCEGNIADMYILQMVSYENFNRPLELSPPGYISEKVKREKEGLKAKMVSLAEAVSRIRGWEKLDDINMKFTDRVSLGRYLVGQINEDYSQEKLEREGFLLKWLGLLPQDADYKENLLNVGISSISALYEPREKIILLGNWVHPAFAEPILVHEITHAFQDKYLDLKKLLEDEKTPDNLDLALARRSFLEGEATAVMLEYLLRSEGKSFKDLEDIFSLIEEKLFKDSQYVRENILYNVYGYGTNFIHAYLKMNDWPRLSMVYKALPLSMREIIHPYKYENKDPAGKSKEKEAGFVPAQDWSKIYDSPVGEFLLLLSFRQFLDRESAQKSVSGWKNDRISVYENDKKNKLIIFSTEWDNTEEAGEFFEAYKKLMKKRYSGISLRGSRNTAFFKTSDKELFFCKRDESHIDILWTEGLRIRQFDSLVRGFN